jgi:AGCS family alanine or glycine:cation symporter
MHNSLNNWIVLASNWLWGPPMLTLVLGVGLYLTYRLRAVQVVSLWRGFREVFKRPDPDSEGDISPFAALMTSIGGLVGNGNIAGVATAITAGGPGALFWMWVSGLIGMGTMFAESVLGVQYRHRGADGLTVGGPMYYLRDALRWRYVAGLFAIGMAVKTLLATTTVQSNSISLIAESELGWNPWLTCGLLSLLTASVVLGGVRSIARVSEFLSPLMGVLYLIGAFGVLLAFGDQLVPALRLVVVHAFSPTAATGGFLGAGVREAFRFGIARGVYSNEAGTGSVPIAHASARSSSPAAQGRIAMLGVFIDTLVVSTATGLALIASGVWTSGADSTVLTAQAFAAGLGQLGGPTVLLASFLFGLSTLFTWAFYGEQCASYLLGPNIRIPYRIVYCAAILGGALAGAQAIWAWADLLNGLMAIPNLIGLVVLGSKIADLARQG